MGIMKFLQKKAWFDYSLHNPFATKEQLVKIREYAQGGWFNDSKKYSEFHPKEDELITELKAMLKPRKPEPLLSRMQYCFERFIRKHTDVSKAALKRRSKEENEAFTKLLEDDKKNTKHWDKIQQANEERYAEWRMKEQARKLSERCFVYRSDRPLRKH